MSTLLPIPSLDPTTSPPADHSIKGVVTLIWPYSSSTAQCAFLLADPDFRLRSRKGQVRVKFTGASARAVAERRVGIGDEVVLGLEGAVWGVDEVRERTPGRGVEGELVFGGRVGLRVWRGGEGVGERVDVDEVDEVATQEQDVGGGNVEAFTPAPRKGSGLLRRSLGSASFAAESGWTYSSPAFAKRVRLSGDLSTYDPFGDGELRSPRKDEGKRTSFGTGLRWRYVGRTPSPEKQGFRDVEDGDVEDVEVVESPSRVARAASAGEHGVEVRVAEKEAAPEVISIDDDDGEDIEEVESPSRVASQLPAQKTTKSISPMATPPKPVSRSSEEAQAPPTAMPPPSLPRLSTPPEERTEIIGQPERPDEPAEEGPSTPKLGPVTSPTLPLPSPFPAETPKLPLPLARPPAYTANSLFGALGSAASVIESRRLSGRMSQGQMRPSQPASLPPPVQPVVPAPPTATVPVSEHVGRDEPSAQAAEPQKEAAVTEAETIDLVDDSDEDVEMLDEGRPAKDSQSGLDHSFSTTIPDDDMYDDYEGTVSQTLAQDDEEIVRQRGQAIDDGTAEQANEGLVEVDEDAPGDEMEEEAGEIRELSEQPEDHSSVLRETSVPPPKPPPNEFSLDGAVFSRPPREPSPGKRKPTSTSEDLRTAELAQSSTPAAPKTSFGLTAGAAQVTPQAERERVKKNTYRNLFGLRSPKKGQPPSPKKASPERQEERFIPGWFFEVNQQQERDGQAEDAAASIEEAGQDAMADNAADRDVSILEPLQPEQPDPPHTAEDETQPEPSPPRRDAGRPSRVEVIELDPSSDVEEDDADDDTPKPAAPELLSSPVVQDSAEDSQDEVFVVSEDERKAWRSRGHAATQKVNQQDQLQTTPLSSAMADERLSALAREATGVEEESQQERDSRVAETYLPNQDDGVVLSPTPKASDLPTLEDATEEHIAPPRSTATTNVVELGSSSESEEFPSSPILRGQKPSGQSPDVTPAQSQDGPHQSTHGPSYPALPLSPSNSQSLQDMNSQPAVEESVRSRLPPTPQLTQRESSSRAEGRPSQKTPARKLLRNESSLRAEVKAAESPITPQTKTPSRRSKRLRPSNVPDVLSEWFSPRSSGAGVDAAKTPSQSQKQAVSTEELAHADAAHANGISTSPEAATPPVHTSGFATAHSYFTPLSKLTSLLNPSSQNSHSPNTLDVLAVVTDKTTDPIRAKTGPKDYYTIFRITDPSLPPNESHRVEVFRPYKNTLPLAHAGDVVLLRGFVVKSRKRTPYLLSADSSAWCVWRYPDHRELDRPAWARKAGSWTGGVEEEVKGPPVEFGEEERGHARGLRGWWVGVKDEGVDEDGEVGKRRVVEEVVAKL